MGSVSKIGESTIELRNNDKHICNSPLNFVYISDCANSAILDKSLSEYGNLIENTAKSILHISNYPDVSEIAQEKNIKLVRRTI